MEEKPFAREVVECDINHEVKNAFMSYAMSVIVSRALPDFRDGLKPVHRRIIYSMDKNNLHHNKSFTKCARIIGDVMGHYHPHGDMAIYDSLVRMAQDFSLRYLLVDGQGNFGSIDGDSAAAYRYTEAKLQKISNNLVSDLSKNTVDFKDNYDGKEQEPVVLPAKFPNLLLNGSTGIAVGMATNIPPHNASEVLTALLELIDNPDMPVEELMNIIKGPDFPTGGIICGRSGIRKYFLTGRGKVKVRAKTRIEEKKGREYIIVDEIPYMVNKANMLMGIVDLIKDKRINGISDIRDESNRLGIRIVVEIKKDAQASVVLNQLFSLSRLQTTFAVNMLGLHNNIPQVLNIPEALRNFKDFRFEVITRRTKFELDECLQKLHIVKGLKIAVDNIDDVIELIKSSSNYSDASAKLITKYELDEVQAKAILDMRISKLTGLEVEKLQKELDELKALSEKLYYILEHDSEIFKIMKDEFQEQLDKFGDDRRTEISDQELDDILDEDLIKKEDVVVTISKSGYAKRIPLDTYKIQKRGGKGVIGATTKEEDIIDQMFVANTHNHLLLFTDQGKIHWLKPYQIPEGGRTAKGRAIVNLIRLAKDEKVTSTIMVENFDKSKNLIFATKSGLLKKTSLEAYSRPRAGGIAAINLMDDDKVVKVLLVEGDEQVLVASKKGYAVKCSESDVRAVGRNSKGVRGINLREKDEVVDFIKINDNLDVLTVTENGYGKRTKASDYRLINRGGKGVINIVTSERNGGVTAVRPVDGSENILLISKNGIIIGVKASDISTIGRNTQGVRIMRLTDGDKCTSVTTFKEDDEDMDQEKIVGQINDEKDMKEIGVAIDKVDESEADVMVNDNELELTEDGHVVRNESYESHHSHSEQIESGSNANDAESDETSEEFHSDKSNYNSEDEESMDENVMEQDLAGDKY